MSKWFIIWAVMAVAGCQGMSEETWRLVSWNGEPVEVPITLTELGGGKIAGRAPCNAYSARTTGRGKTFRIGPIAATKRACPQLKLEAAYFSTLQSVTSLEKLNGTVTLRGADGIKLTFKPHQPPAQTR